MHRQLIRLLRVVDVRVLYCFCDVFVVPFCILFNRSGRTSFAFYRTRLGYGFGKSLYFVWRNHCLFAQIVIDRFAMYAGKAFDVEIVGVNHLKRLEDKEDGFVLLSSHIGNYELAGYSLRTEKKTLHAIVYSNEKETVMQNRDNLFGKMNVSMIALREDMGHLFEIDAALRGGDIVSFPADRRMGDARCVKVPFLGAEAGFPQGPFSVTTMRGVEVLALNVMKESPKRYKLYIAVLPYDRQASRQEQIRQLALAYVAELEKRIRQYPAQWFNFFDFWAA
ncbi:MAG: lysophospholipid acyltransferase family protein [Bacteroidales bacterium]|nr:lysophospholipid acyltransferase family protein [Bacteroidales bacterium]